MSLTLKKYVHRAVRWQFLDPSIFLPLTPPKHAPTPAKVTAKPHNRWQRRQPRQPKQPPVKLELVGMFRLFFSTYLLNYFISFMWLAIRLPLHWKIDQENFSSNLQASGFKLLEKCVLAYYCFGNNNRACFPKDVWRWYTDRALFSNLLRSHFDRQASMVYLDKLWWLFCMAHCIDLWTWQCCGL